MIQYTEKAMELQRWAEWCEYHRHDEHRGFVDSQTQSEGPTDAGNDSSEGEED